MNVKYRLRGVNPLIYLLLILAFLSVGIGTAAAANPIVSITASDTEVCVGESFDVFIAVNPNGNSLQSTQVDLGYDSSKVDITVDDGGMFGLLFHPGTSGAGTVNDISGLDTGTTIAGNLAVLHVTANAAGTVNLDLTDVVVGTGSGTLTPTVNGETLTITVCGGDPAPDAPIVEILPTPKSVCVDNTFDINITVDPNGNSLQSTQVDLGYDSSKVDITVDDGGMFGLLFHPGTSGAGTVNDISGLDAGTTIAGNLAVLHVTANAAGTVNLDLTDVVVGTGSGTLTPTVNGGVIEIAECAGPFQPPTPQPRITVPTDGATIVDAVEIIAVDDSSSDNITYNLFEYCTDSGGSCAGTWSEIGNDTDGTPWDATWNTKFVMNGDYLIRATMGDSTNGLDGTDTIGVTIENEMPEWTIPLMKGWNFISILGTLDNSTPGYVLDGIAYDALYQYNASTGIWENVAFFEPGIGYAIKASEESQIIVNLETTLAPPAEIKLYPGWNAIGPVGDPEALPGNAEDVFYAVDSLYPTVIGEWNGVYYEQYGNNADVAAGSNPPAYVDTTAFTVNPFRGYWMFANAGTP